MGAPGRTRATGGEYDRSVEASGARIEPGNVIGEAFDAYRENAGPLIGAAVVLVGGGALASGLLSTADSILLSLLGSVIYLIVQALFTGFVVRLVEDVRDGRRDHSVGDLLSSARHAVPTLILAAIVYVIAVVIGLVLLIVPGLILITIWAVFAPAIVVERVGVFRSFGRSRELVKGNGWSVFATIILAFLILIFFSFVMVAVGTAIGGDAGQAIFNTIASILAAPVVALVASILYFELGGGGAAAAASHEAPPTITPPAA
jgi:hypothetical protein